MRRNFARILFIPFTSIVLAVSCDSTGPSTVEDVRNERDNFRFKIEDISDFSGTFRYLWNHTGTTATVNKVAAFDDGLGSIEITDDAGARVYFGNVTEAGNAVTDAGQPGTWTVNIILVRVYGTMEVNIRKQ